MTKEQKESLEIVKAHEAEGRYHSKETGTYNHSDISNILMVYRSAIETLEVIEEDAKTALYLLQDANTNPVSQDLLRGVLDFIREQK